MASITVKVKRKNPGALDKINKRYRQNNHVLEVGFPKELVGNVVYPSVRNPDNPSEFIKSEAPPRVVDVAFINEFGSYSRNVPPRPFMRESSKPAEKIIKSEGKKLSSQLNQKSASPQLLAKFLQTIGPKVASVFQKTITNLREPPNAPSTIEIKKSDNPLIDTGLMRQTLTYLVKRKRKSKGD